MSDRAVGDLTVQVPGDKSLTHRCLLLSALATGRSRIGNPLISDDTRATVKALESCGIRVERTARGALQVSGRGLQGFSQPSEPIDCGNSGTTARLLMGILAGQSLTATLIGDESLSKRPMERLAGPLRMMGADVRWEEDQGRLPLTITGGPLRPIDYDLPVASAQLKSALLLAGLTGGAFALLTEPGRSRDHTERLLAAMGAPTIGHHVAGGWRVELRDPPQELRPLDFTVPGDPSTAAFFVVWALLQGGDRRLRLPDVAINPTRTGFLSVLERMGASIDVLTGAGDVEPVGELVVTPSSLRSTMVEGPEIPKLLDEIPLLAVAAARARGITSIRGAAELRLKESDRLAALAHNLRSIGVTVEEYPDGLDIEGTTAPLRGSAGTFGDHRIEMAFAVLGETPDADIEVVGPPSAAVSYPEFWEELSRMAGAAAGGQEGRPGETARRPVVVIDGPAGSGKSTTARAVAARLGLAHLDSGSLYRALTLAVLRSGVPESEWVKLTEADWADFRVGVEPTTAGLSVQLRGQTIPDEELRTPHVTSRVSVVAALPAVRACLLELQRQAARDGGLVADGRDMGSVVFPDADVKVFLIADLEERARRRLKEVGGAADGADGIAVAANELQRRDFRDTHREHSPLRRPDGAVTIDTTTSSPTEQVDAVVRLVRAVWPDAPPDDPGTR